MRRMVLAVPPLLVALGALALGAGTAAASGRSQTVYTSSNSASGNSVLAFERTAGGSLHRTGSFATGGNGTGGGLSNQGALAFGPGDHTLYVVNAGSNSVSAFAVRHDGLELLGSTPSGGAEPVSLAVRGDRLYVVNAGDNSVSGFRGAASGRLSALTASSTSLPGEGPAQISFSRDGRELVVTERVSNTIVTVPIGGEGALGSPVSNPSSGATPFGFAVDERNHVIVSEAAGGPDGTSAVSSYRFGRDGTLSAISASVGDEQKAACWVVLAKEGRFAYTANTASPSISSYVVSRDGSLSLLEPVAAANAPGSHTTDLARAQDDLFALTAGVGTISSYGIEPNGHLVSTGSAPEVPASATGLIAH